MDINMDIKTFEITNKVVEWIVSNRIHRDFNKEVNPRLTLNELHHAFEIAFPESVGTLDFGTAKYIDEQLCGSNNCGGFWRQAYDFPGESYTTKFNEDIGLIRVISTGIFTFDYEYGSSI